MTGTTLSSLECVPASVLRKLAKGFRQSAPEIATLRALYRRRPTRFEYQRWVIQQYRLREFDWSMEQKLTDHIRARTHGDAVPGTCGAGGAGRVVSGVCCDSTATTNCRSCTRRYTVRRARRSSRFAPEHDGNEHTALLQGPADPHRTGGSMTHLEWLRTAAAAAIIEGAARVVR